MNEKTLSRAEVNRRIQSLTVDPWKNLSGNINGCHVNAWATGHRRRISRISICAIPKLGGNAAGAIKLAKQLKSATGLVIHWHGGMTGATINLDGSVISSFYVRTPKLP